MRINFIVNTNNRKIANLERKIKNLDVETILSKTANNLIKEMQKTITTGTRSGNVYGNHQSSAPGEPPAHWHGGLFNSMIATKKSSFEYEVSFTVPYAKDLELGEGSISGNPRPFVQPSVDTIKKQFEKDIIDIFKRYV